MYSALFELSKKFASQQVHLIHVLLLIAVTSIVFSNTLENTYHLDSIYRVQKNTELEQFWPPTRFFTDVRTGSTIRQIAEFRPIMPLSNAINIKISELFGISKLRGFHIGNITIHIGSTILVYFLFCLMIGEWGRFPVSNSHDVKHSQKAFAAAIIFAVHPIAGSAVNYIAARDLLLMVFFFIASILIYIRMRKKGDTISGWLVSILLLCLAILSKQAAIVAFGLIFLFEWLVTDSKLKDWRLWARASLFCLPTVAFFLLRKFWIEDQISIELRTFKDFTYPLTMLDAHLFYYLRNFAWPFEMRALARVDVVESILTPSAMAGLIFILMTLAIAWFYRIRQPLISFSILAYWWLFALTSSIFPFRYAVTDYRQYLPFTFLCLIVSLIVFSLKKRALPIILFASMTAYYSIASYSINQHWQTEESFWRQSVKYGGSALAHSNYALSIGGKNPKLAEHHYLEALRQNPYHIYANINLGMLYINQKKTEEGLGLLRSTVDRNPNWALAHYWMSRGLRKSGQLQESLAELLRAADLDPRNVQYQYEVAQVLQNQGNKKSSIVYLEQLMKFDPDYKLAGFLLGFAYQKTNDIQRAIDEYILFLEHRPQHVQTHFNLAFALMNAGDCIAAIEHFKIVINLRSQYREAHRHLSYCFASLGDDSLATKHEKLYLGEQ